MSRIHIGAAAGLAAAALILALAAPAAATTFCVPGYHAACPNQGGNVAQPDLEVAMDTNDNDGEPDRILIQGVTLTDTGTFDNGSGGDPLEIIGAGAGQTVLTSSLVGGNNFVLNLSSRPTDVRDLTVVIPASFSDGLGSGIQALDSTLRDVDVESRNDGSNGISSLGGGSSFIGGEIRSAQGGAIISGIRPNPAEVGAVEIVDATITGAFVGVSSDSAATPVFVRRSRIASQTVGVETRGSGIANVLNTVIEAGDGGGVIGHTLGAQGPVLLTVRGTTIVGSGSQSGNEAVEAEVVSGAAGSVNVFVHDSIIRGFQTTYRRQAPIDPGDGQANLTLRYSNFTDNGSTSGDGLLTLGPANIDVDPLFTSATNYRLLVGSPSIDAADPMPSVALTDDFDGLSRPFDGDADGDARRDMGAFEYRPAPPVDPGDPLPGAKKKKKKCKRKKKKGKAKAGASAKKKKRKKCRRKKRRKRR